MLQSSSAWLTTRRIAGIAGLGYVFGVAIENMEILDAPTLSSSVAEIRAAYADHALAVVTSLAGAVALLFYGAFVAALVSWLPERPGGRGQRSRSSEGSAGPCWQLRVCRRTRSSSPARR